MKCTIVFQKIHEAIIAMDEQGDRKYRYIILTGSSRSSKTASIIQVLDWYARYHPHKRVTSWRDTHKECKDTVLFDMLRYYKMWNLYGVDQRFNKTESYFTYNSGSTLEIHGTDIEEKVMGLNKDVCHLNEPYKISRSIFDQLDQRTTDFVIVDWNPKENHWIDDIAKDPRAIVIHSTFKDNPFCPEEQRIKILSYQPVIRCNIVTTKLLTETEAKQYDLVDNPLSFTDKQVRELLRCRENEAKNSANDFNWLVYGLGIKGERPNRIFHWTEISNEVYKAIDTPIYIGVDWGTVDPWGILEAKYSDGCLYLHELNYASENEIRAKLTPTDLAVINAEDEEGGIVKWLFAKLNISKKYPIICDTNRPLKIAALRRAGYNAWPAQKGANSILDGIDLLNNLREVFFTASSTNLKSENEAYSRTVDRYGVVLEEPEDANCHLHDPSRYLGQYLKSIGVIKQF